MKKKNKLLWNTRKKEGRKNLKNEERKNIKDEHGIKEEENEEIPYIRH